MIHAYEQALSEISEKAIEWRRDFHKYPEVAWTEFRTTAKIIETLEENGIKMICGLEMTDPRYAWSYPGVDEIDEQIRRAVWQGGDKTVIRRMKRYTGAMAELTFAEPGPVIAVRFDIDGLGVTESHDPSHRPFAEGFVSRNAGVMHACGHDGHAAIGMALCLLLNKYKDLFRGRIKIIFQPGEEGARGANAVAESGILDDVDVLISGHLGMGVPSDTVALFSEGYLASTKWDLNISGMSSHAGAAPEKGHNAILAASAAILAMYSFCQDSRGATRVNVGTIKGGTGRNVVADQVLLEMETRGQSNEVEQDLYEVCTVAANASSHMYGCTSEITIRGRAPIVRNDHELAGLLKKGVSQAKTVKTVLPDHVVSGSEDIGYLMKKVQDHGGKAAFIGIGCDIAGPHHSSLFDIDESSLKMAVDAYFHILLAMDRAAAADK